LRTKLRERAIRRLPSVCGPMRMRRSATSIKGVQEQLQQVNDFSAHISASEVIMLCWVER